MDQDKPIFEVTIENSKLPKAKFFKQLDFEILNEFRANKIFIRGDTPVLRKGDKIWRITKEEGKDVRSFALELSYDEVKFVDIIQVYEDTLSGLPKDIWDSRIFHSGFVFGHSKRRFLYDGKPRKKLNEKQKKKWDYFFTPDFTIIEKEIDTRASKYRNELEIQDVKLKKSRNIIITFIALVSAYFLFGFACFSLGLFDLIEAIIFGMLLLIVGVVFAFLVSGMITTDKISFNLKEIKNEIEILQAYLNGFKKEKENLIRQLEERNVPSHAQILTWFNEEAEELKLISKSKYLFAANEKSEFKSLISSAIFQPDFKLIRSYFSDEIETFLACKRTEEQIIYSGLYFVHIFLTDDKICISRLFYDFILRKKYKDENKEYHFTNLVGIAINSIIVQDPYNDSGKQMEVSAIWMSFTDGNSLEIAIKDIIANGVEKTIEITPENINQNIENNSPTITTMGEAMNIVGWVKEKKRNN